MPLTAIFDELWYRRRVVWSHMASVTCNGTDAATARAACAIPDAAILGFVIVCRVLPHLATFGPAYPTAQLAS